MIDSYLADAGDLFLGKPETWQGAVPRGWRTVRGRGPRSGCAVTQTSRQHTENKKQLCLLLRTFNSTAAHNN